MLKNYPSRPYRSGGLQPLFLFFSFRSCAMQLKKDINRAQNA